MECNKPREEQKIELIAEVGAMARNCLAYLCEFFEKAELLFSQPIRAPWRPVKYVRPSSADTADLTIRPRRFEYATCVRLSFFHLPYRNVDLAVHLALTATVKVY